MKRILVLLLAFAFEIAQAEDPVVTGETFSSDTKGDHPITGGFLTKPIDPLARQIVILNSSTNATDGALRAFADKIITRIRLSVKVANGDYTSYDNSKGDAVLAVVDKGEMVVFPKKNLVIIPIGDNLEGSLQEGLLSLCGLNGSEPIIRQNISIMAWAKSHGLASAKRVAYKKACQEGWAPAPTNDIQKAIWDKVMAEKAKATNATQKASAPAK